MVLERKGQEPKTALIVPAHEEIEVDSSLLEGDTEGAISHELKPGDSETGALSIPYVQTALENGARLFATEGDSTLLLHSEESQAFLRVQDQLIDSIPVYHTISAGWDKDFSFEPHLALFMKLQEAYPNYQKQFSYVLQGLVLGFAEDLSRFVFLKI